MKTDNTISQNLACSIHNRQVEGYCKECGIYVCSSCLFGMSNPHKNHNLVSLEDLATILRETMNGNCDVIQSDYCQTKSMDAIQAKAAIETQTKQLIEKIVQETDQLIKIITKRKEYIINQITEKAKKELADIGVHIEKWKQKSQIAQSINKLQIDVNDKNIYVNMMFITKGLEMLKEPQKTYEYNYINDYHQNIVEGDNILSFEQLCDILSGMYAIKEDDTIQVPYKA